MVNFRSSIQSLICLIFIILPALLYGQQGDNTKIPKFYLEKLQLFVNKKQHLIECLNAQHIQFVEYGDIATLIIPTDHYFYLNSSRINLDNIDGLNNAIKLIKSYPPTPIFVAGFTDNIGTKTHQNNLSRAQAEAILTYLWANNIKANRLHAESYGVNYAIGDNSIIHGSAFNRRVEIQWAVNFYPLEESKVFK